MQISIITFHDTANFGATLQCVALSSFLKKHGHSVEIIDYLPKYVLNKKSICKELQNIKKADNKIKSAIKGVIYLIFFDKIRRKNLCFEKFIKQNIQLSSPYYSYTDIETNPPTADIYICGSDQIWNPALTGGDFDKAFFLQFTKKKKISYAVSFGEYDLEHDCDMLKTLTSCFTGISVREKSSALKLSNILKKDVCSVLDCSLLLEKKDYEAMESVIELPDTPFLLFYSISRSKKAESIARKIATEKKMSIIDISPNPFIRLRGANKKIGIGPGEFLFLIKNAQYVVTNSFHGTAFSVIYKKDFITVPHSTRGNRMKDLLTIIGLSERLYLNEEIPLYNKINWSLVYNNLNYLRNKSIDYLHSNIQRM